MGLSISSGRSQDIMAYDEEAIEWLQSQLISINEVLAEMDMPTFTEPDSVPRFESRALVTSFPYSLLHYLRRFYAHCIANPDTIPSPCAEGDNPSRDEILDKEMFMMDSHLLCHSDCEGFYFPLDFGEVIIDSESQGANGRIVGGLLGSSYRLREELILIAPKLGIELSADPNDPKNVVLSDSEAERINEIVREQAEWERELLVWIALFEAATFSVEHQVMILFG